MRPSLLALALAVSIAVAAPLTACWSTTCEGQCQRNLDDCLQRAPPGASRADCISQHDACLQSCQRAAPAGDGDGDGDGLSEAR